MHKPRDVVVECRLEADLAVYLVVAQRPIGRGGDRRLESIVRDLGEYIATVADDDRGTGKVVLAELMRLDQRDWLEV